MPDEIIEELWEIKDSLAREHGNDVRKLAAYLQSKKNAKSVRMTDLVVMNELSDSDNSHQVGQRKVLMKLHVG